MAPAGFHIQAVVFDLDDTLFRERDYVRSGFSAVGQHLRGRLHSRADFEGWMWRRFLSGRREKMFDALSRHFRLGLKQAAIRRLVELYRRHRPRIRPCRGVAELLGSLRRRRVKLGLLTDGYLPTQRLKLSAAGLERYFHAVVFTEQMGRSAWKPSPAGFVSIRRRLGAPATACAYVADNPAKDFLAPNQLGWLTVQWRRARQLHAHNPAPDGGKSRIVVRSGPELMRVVLHRSRGGQTLT